jgi:DMSO/TMAO reductase YedYZ molybdopterin-dependent catalytic subunit
MPSGPYRHVGIRVEAADEDQRHRLLSRNERFRMNLLDQPPPVPESATDIIQNLQPWEELVESFITPNKKFYSIAHYGRPAVDAPSWSLEIGGLVRRPLSFTLAELRRGRAARSPLRSSAPVGCGLGNPQ